MGAGASLLRVSGAAEIAHLDRNGPLGSWMDSARDNSPAWTQFGGSGGEEHVLDGEGPCGVAQPMWTAVAGGWLGLRACSTCCPVSALGLTRASVLHGQLK